MISRLETMILMSGLNLNPSTARRMIASSIDMIIHLEKLKDGRRILTSISELLNKCGSIGGNTILEVKDIFKYGQKVNTAGNGKPGGDHIIYTGYVPAFMDKVITRGFNFNFKDEDVG